MFCKQSLRNILWEINVLNRKKSKKDLAAAEEETENLSRDLDAVESELEQERNAKTGTYPISHKNNNDNNNIF